MGKIFHFRKHRLLNYGAVSPIPTAPKYQIPKTQPGNPSSSSSVNSGDSTSPRASTSAYPVVTSNVFIPSTENHSYMNTIQAVQAPEQSIAAFPAIQSNNENNPILLPSPFQTSTPACGHDIKVFIDIETISQYSDSVATNRPNRPQILANDAVELIDAQNKLNASIEANLSKKQRAMMHPRPSTILLAKLNQLKKKSPIKVNNATVSVIRKAPTFGFTNPIAQITDNLQGFIGIDSTLYKEKKKLVIRNESFVNNEKIEEIKVKREPTSYDDELPCTSSSVRIDVEGRRNVQPRPVPPIYVKDFHAPIYVQAPKPEPIHAENNQADPEDIIDVESVETLPVSTTTDENTQIASSPVSTEPTQLEPNPVPQTNVTMDDIQEILHRTARIAGTTNDYHRNINHLLERGVTIHLADLPLTPPPTPRPDFVHITADTTPEELTHLRAIPNNNINNVPPTATDFEAIRRQIAEKYPFVSPTDPDSIVIGPNGTVVPKGEWSKIDWTLSVPAITRKIMMGVFDRETMATHTLTGRPSPAFRDLYKPEKKPLDGNKVADIIHLMSSHSKTTTKEIRMAITTKCADECKMFKWREVKKKDDNKENNGNPPQ